MITEMKVFRKEKLKQHFALACKYDNEDPTNVVNGDSSTCFTIIFTHLEEYQIKLLFIR